MKGKPLMTFVVYGIFFILLGAYASEPLVRGIDRVLFIVGVFPWQYWFASAIVFTLLLLWLNDYFVDNVYLRSAKMKRIMQFTAGFGFWSSTSWVFDNIMYPGVIAWRGLLEGGLIMASVAIVVELSFLMVYEYKKVDWMGMDALESIRNDGDIWIMKFNGKQYHGIVVKIWMRIIMFFPVMIFRIVLWMLKKGDVFAFFALSIFMAPFPTTIYLRHGRFDGLRKKDWMIFIASAILGNVYWTLRSYGVVVIIRYFIHSV